MSDTPDGPEDGDTAPGDSGGADGAEEPLRGWIDPDDRLWRHPSEVSPSGGAPGPTSTAPVLINAPPRHHYRGAVMALVGIVAVMAVAAWILVLLSPASQRPIGGASTDAAGGATLTTLAGPQNALPAAAQAAAHSMVELRATTAHGPVALIGVAVGEGGLVATTADVLGGVRRIVMVGPAGKTEPASIVATDPASDVALVTVPDDVPVAPFADDSALDGGSPDSTLSFVPDDGSSLALHSTPGSVTGVAAPIAGGPADGMPCITSTPVASASIAGEPLLNSSGDVIGILYDPGDSTPGTFLPSQLVVGVADDLRSRQRVVHGWLGVSGTDAPGGTGATVAAVQANSPAAGRLQAGQVIVAVDAMPVRTMAELRARLYVLPPGAPITVSVHESSGTKLVDITLSPSS